VVSNWDSRLPDILEELGLTRFLDTVTVSRVEGIEKPNPEIFLRTAARLGIAPETALHVGDSPLEDYRGATDAGLHAVLLDRAGLFRDDGYLRIERLDTLIGLLES
jgi:FMN phosphatase YigB (HAD superfamily)